MRTLLSFAFLQHCVRCGVATLLLILSHHTLADYTLQLDKSQLNFVSIKNEHIAEQHSFDVFSGMLAASGELSIKVELASVNTLIPIRNERMQAMLFKVGNFPTATFSASISDELLNMSVGEFATTSLDGTLVVQENSVPIEVHVVISRLSSNTFLASTAKPILLSTTALGLDDGVEALRNIAMLNGISKTVPITFSAVFTD